MPIKWGSALTSKLAKKYWEKPQVAGLPLAFAIHDFHGPGTLLWSLHSLSDYLFGLRNQEDGQDVPVESHTHGAKVIPSGFFQLPGAENISAVIASNEATLPKFNRMAQIAGFGDPAIRIKRIGAQLDLATMAVTAFETTTQRGVANESWLTGIWVFHNPHARLPIPFDSSRLAQCLPSGWRAAFFEHSAGPRAAIGDEVQLACCPQTTVLEAHEINLPFHSSRP